MPLRLHMILLRKHNQIQNSIWPSTSDMNFPDIWRHRTFGGIENNWKTVVFQQLLENLQNLILAPSQYWVGMSTKYKAQKVRKHTHTHTMVYFTLPHGRNNYTILKETRELKVPPWASALWLRNFQPKLEFPSLCMAAVLKVVRILFPCSQPAFLHPLAHCTLWAMFSEFKILYLGRKRWHEY